MGKCIRCGMCCLIEPCLFGKIGSDGNCAYLTVNDDNTTTCNNEYAVEEFVGQGCVFMSDTFKELYEDRMEFYQIDERKQELLSRRKSINGNKHRVFSG
jgi:hypothetical protein